MSMFRFILLVLFFSCSAAYAAKQDDIDFISRIAFGRAADVQYLLEKKIVSPDVKNNNNIPAILIAVMNRNTNDPEVVGIVKALLDAGANPNTIGPNGEILIIEAVKHANADVVKVIIDNQNTVLSVKDRNGVGIEDLAKARKDEKLLAVVQAGLKYEQTRISALKSGENLSALVRKYSFLNCANTYLAYYMKMEKPKKLNEEGYKKVIEKNSSLISTIEHQLTKLFSVGTNDLQTIRDETNHSVTEELDFFLTDKNRLFNGIGTDKDLNKRCNKIADGWSKKVEKPKS